MTFEELLPFVEAHVRKTWGVDEFVLLDTFHKKSWWGGYRRVFVVEVHGKRLALFVREDDAEVFGHKFVPSPDPREITGLQALEIAMREARRLNCTNFGESAVTKVRGAWIVQTGINIISVNPGFQICDRTGEVQGRWCIPRPGQIRR